MKGRSGDTSVPNKCLECNQTKPIAEFGEWWTICLLTGFCEYCFNINYCFLCALKRYKEIKPILGMLGFIKFHNGQFYFENNISTTIATIND